MKVLGCRKIEALTQSICGRIVFGIELRESALAQINRDFNTAFYGYESVLRCVCASLPVDH